MTIPTAPEKMEYDRTSDRIYQNIKSNNTVQVIDPATNKVEKTFDTAPAVGPHGLAIDGKNSAALLGRQQRQTGGDRYEDRQGDLHGRYRKGRGPDRL